MLKVASIFSLSFFVVYATAQTNQQNLSPSGYNVDSLKDIYGQNKRFLKEYELQTLIALSYYPELADENIRFTYGSINSTAQTTVTVGSIFKRLDKHYIIIINNDIKKTGMLLSDAPFDGQVALIAHELAHVIDFKDRGFFEMLWWGISYLIVKPRMKIEIEADIITIHHGLGWPLLSWTDFVLNHSTANRKYIKMKRSKYLSTNEIVTFTRKYENADSTERK